MNNLKKEVCTRFDVYSSDTPGTKREPQKRHNLLFKQKSGNILRFLKYEAMTGDQFWFI